MPESIPVISQHPDGEQKLLNVEKGSYLYRILSRPGQRAFTMTKSGIRYERTSD